MDELSKEIGKNIITFPCDVTKESEVKNAIEGTVNHWGKLQAAIACAGIAKPIIPALGDEWLDIENFKRHLDINVMGSVYMAKHASLAIQKTIEPSPVNADRGVMIFTSSICAE